MKDSKRWSRRWRQWLETKGRRLRQRRKLGSRGEWAATRWLRQHGMVIVGRGVREGRGELDLVAVDGDTLVFVEVKTRRTHDQGHPAEAVDLQKQRQLTRLALAYLRRHHLLECRWRFDIVAITWPEAKRRPQIEHFRAAFEPVGCDSLFT